MYLWKDTVYVWIDVYICMYVSEQNQKMYKMYEQNTKTNEKVFDAHLLGVQGLALKTPMVDETLLNLFWKYLHQKYAIW